MDIVPSFLAQWQKANSLLKPPIIISEKRICDKIVGAWTTVRDIANKRITKNVVIDWLTNKLDKLFDVCKCQCTIKTSEETQCSGRSTGAHRLCCCSRDQNISIIELGFIKAQRDKIGEVSSIQMIGDDKKVSERQMK